MVKSVLPMTTQALGVGIFGGRGAVARSIALRTTRATRTSGGCVFCSFLGFATVVYRFRYRGGSCFAPREVQNERSTTFALGPPWKGDARRKRAKQLARPHRCRQFLIIEAKANVDAGNNAVP